MDRSAVIYWKPSMRHFAIAVLIVVFAGCDLFDSEEGIPADQFNGVWKAAQGDTEYTLIFQGVGTYFSSRYARVLYLKRERELSFPVQIQFDHPEIAVRGSGSESRSLDEQTEVVDSTSLFFEGEFITGDDLRMEGTLADTTHIYQYDYDEEGILVDSSVYVYEETFPVTFRKQSVE